MPDSESRHLDAETLLFSLAWELQAGEHWSTGGKNWLERTASNNVRGSRLCTHPSPTPWNTPRCGASGGPCSCPKPGPVHGAAGTTPVPSGREHHCQHPSCSLPVLRTESVAGTTANAQWASTASKSKFKHTDVNTRMTMKNQVKKQVDDP